MSKIKVCLRVKPLLEEEDLRLIPLQIKGKRNEKKLYIRNKKKNKQTKIFNFDEIFEQSCSQQEVYSTFKNDLMDSALNGVIL